MGRVEEQEKGKHTHKTPEISIRKPHATFSFTLLIATFMHNRINDSLRPRHIKVSIVEYPFLSLRSLQVSRYLLLRSLFDYLTIKFVCIILNGLGRRYGIHKHAETSSETLSSYNDQLYSGTMHLSVSS